MRRLRRSTCAVIFDGQTVYLAPDTPRELLPPDLGDRTSFLCFLFFVLEAA